MHSVEFVHKQQKKFLDPPDIARLNIASWETVNIALILLSILLTFLFPPLGLAVSLPAVYYFYDTVYRKYFEDPEIRAEYERQWKPKITRAQYLQIGYEVYPSELSRHLKEIDNLLEDGEDQEKAIKELTKKAQLYKKLQRYRLVGYQVKLITTHKWIIGTTGAGKTSYIMQGFLKQFEQGGGVIFVDGKADVKGALKFIKLAEKAGRLSDVLILNFLTADQYKKHTNTYNPFMVFSPAILMEFLDSLVPAEGDQAFWKGRGVDMLRPLVFGFAFRKKYWNEPFSYETLSNYRKASSYGRFASLIYSLALLEDKLLKESGDILPIVNEAKKFLQAQTPFPYLELIVNYMQQNPSVKPLIEQAGFNVDYLADLWEVYGYFSNWLSSIADDWERSVLTVAKVAVKNFTNQLKAFSLRDYMEAFDDIIKAMREDKKFESVVGWMTQPQSTNPDAMQQHQYGVMQWDKVFNTFRQYSHIFGALQSDVDFEDVVKNNKLLYILLPPLKQSEETTMFLGRLIIMSIRQAISRGLGGAIELTRRQAEVFTAKISPSPPLLVVLDEYGAYPVEGLDTILAQARSIGVSVWIATQDFTSGRIKGERREDAVLRMWANTNIKVLLKNLDKEVIDILQNWLPKVRVAEQSMHFLNNYVVEDTSVVLRDESIFQGHKLEYFKNGLAFIIGEGKYAITQVEYRDEKPVEKFILTRLEPIPLAS